MFRNYLIWQVKICHKCSLQQGSVVAVCRARNTYLEWICSLLNFILPTIESSPTSVEIIYDTYLTLSVKNGTQFKRGEQSQRTYIQGFDQKMLKGKNWGNFFNNIENIKDLIRLVARYLTRSDGRKQFTISLVIKEEEKTWEVFGYVP